MDRFGYYWIDSNLPAPSVGFNWIEINGTGTDTGLVGNDVAGCYPIGFTFGFYWGSYAEVCISTNGLMTFEEPDDSWWNMGIPASHPPNSYIAPYWDDLCVNYSGYNTGAIYYQTVGLPPNRQFVAEWWAVSGVGSSDPMTFEAILNETGEIWFQYLSMSTNNGGSATIGIEAQEGEVGSQYSCNSPVVLDGLAVMFVLETLGFGPDELTGRGLPGGTASYELGVLNNQGADDSFDIDYYSEGGWRVELFDNDSNPLTDTNGNGIPDSGTLHPNDVKIIIVTITIPDSPPIAIQQTFVTATSFNNPDVSKCATLHTYVVSAKFVPPHSDWGDDSNGDGLYESLVIVSSINATSPGVYLIAGNLYDGEWNLIFSVGKYGSLVLGLQIVELRFPCWPIREFGVAGPYNVELGLSNDVRELQDVSTHTTSFYSHMGFGPIPASLCPPHCDYSLDSDGDGLYNYLVVNVTVDVATAGYYRASGYLCDQWWQDIAWVKNETYLDPGLRVVRLLYPGWLIYRHAVDGPYGLELSLSILLGDQWEGIVDGLNWTSSYLWSDFESLPAELWPPYGDAGVDTDSDGLYDYLAVDVRVRADIAGQYRVAAWLYDQGGDPIRYSENVTYLDPGVQLVRLCYEGYIIREHSVPGPYRADLYLSEYYTGIELGNGVYWTGAYELNEFERPFIDFDPPHSDYGLDNDGDSQFEYLFVDVNVFVSEQGWYRIGAVLYGYSLFPMVNAFDSVFLEVGAWSVLLKFPGWAIYAHGLDGPYSVHLVALWLNWSAIDWDYHVTQSYACTEFDSNVPVLASSWAYDAPDMDGTCSPQEWRNATAVDLLSVDASNDVPAWLLIMNNGTHLFICYDVIGDLTEDPSDLAAMSFDTGNDCIKTDGGEDQFIITDQSPDAQTHVVYSSTSGWTTDCSPFDQGLSDHSGLAGAMGMGPSDLSSLSHRIVEFSIPLALLDAGPGDALGFSICNSYVRGIYDEGSLNYSSWPGFFPDEDLHHFGDLVLAAARPSTVADLRGSLGMNHWYVSAVTVALIAIGGEGGIDRTMYRLGAGAWQTYAAPIVVGTEGTHTMEFYSVDKGGNQEETRNISFKVDIKPPATALYLSGASQGPGGWYSASIHAQLNAANGSGSAVNSTYYELDGGAWQRYAGVFTVSGAGNHTLEYYSIDDAGNEEAVNTTYVRIDQIAPSSSPSVDGTLGTGGWYKSAVTVAIVATDEAEGSGVHSITYRVDGGAPQTYAAPLSISGDGTHTIEYFSVDGAGNQETANSVTVRIDRAAPSTTASVSESTVTLSATDVTSGVARTVYRIDGGTWTNYTESFDVTAKGNHTIEYYSVDNAGNSEAVKTTWVEIPSKGLGLSGTQIGIMLGAAAVVVLVVLALLWKRRKLKPFPVEPETEEAKE